MNGSTRFLLSIRSHSSFTSESVSAGHPDKVCDQISDAVLDQVLRIDPTARVACEAMIKTVDEKTRVVIAGEIKASGKAPCVEDAGAREGLVRDALEKAGYVKPEFGVNLESLEVVWLVGAQSENISGGVDKGDRKKQGAGDQGMMFGYACRETDSLMPMPIDLAHRLIRRHAELFRSGEFAELGPDAKAQLTVAYRDGRPERIESVVLSTQHTDAVGEKDLDEFRERVKERIIAPVLPGRMLNGDIRYHINPAGLFKCGGPAADCGLTGRKIIVDTYGGVVRHGGGAFSGKDPSKVDRSAAYAARYVAKNLVAAGLAERCEVQLSYAIGYEEPNSVSVNTDDSCRLDNDRLVELVEAHFDLRPGGITEMLDLERPIYSPTAAYGHFGREEYRGAEGLFPWEKCGKVGALQDAVSDKVK